MRRDAGLNPGSRGIFAPSHPSTARCPHGSEPSPEGRPLPSSVLRRWSGEPPATVTPSAAPPRSAPRPAARTGSSRHQAASSSISPPGGGWMVTRHLDSGATGGSLAPRRDCGSGSTPCRGAAHVAPPCRGRSSSGAKPPCPGPAEHRPSPARAANGRSPHGHRSQTIRLSASMSVRTVFAMYRSPPCASAT